ncbi:MAG: YaiO family outer membrane beta-barrel protein [Christiangramia sp.]
MRSFLHSPICLMLVFCLSFSLHAQQEMTSDELFQKARTEAFDNDNYPEAIRLSRLALEKSPDYTDIRIFLGRLYTWSDQPELARQEFEEVLAKNPGHEDGSFAYGSLEYWNDQSDKALQIVNNGLEVHPKSQNLLLLKAKVLKDLKRFPEANTTVNQLLKINPKLTEARSLLQSIKNVSANNEIGIDYEYTYFDKRFEDPWHLAGIDYSRATKIGTIIGRFNYGNRFTNSGSQFIVEAYPSISETFYAYVSGGVMISGSIFPDYRAGFSLYANLPASFEGEVGFRMLNFGGDNTWIYTASVGKYVSNFWFNLRTYQTPSNDRVSQSYSLTTRYYFGGADDFLSLRLGTGISPDNESNNILYNDGNPYNLKSHNVTLDYRFTVKNSNIFFISGSLQNQEYQQNTRGNQISGSLGYIKRF